MQLSITSIFSIIVFSLLVSIVLAAILSDVRLLKKMKCEVILACFFVLVLKMLIPVEIIPWTVNIDVRGQWADMFAWLTQNVSIGQTISMTRWEFITILICIFGVGNVIREFLLYGIFSCNVRSMPEVKDESLHRMVDNILGEYQRKKKIQIKRTNMVVTPSITGIWNVTILVPESFPEELEWEGMLRHEIAHYVYGDIWIRFVWSVVKAFHFWNPVVYILDGQLIKILEVRADEKAVQKMTEEKRHQYRATLAIMANHAGKQKQKAYSVTFLHKKGLLVKKRIELLEAEYQRTVKELITNYLIMVLGVMGLFVLMNCFILEPISSVPEDQYEKSRMVTADSCFLIRNADGTYDMYMDGVYCATIEETFGMDLPVYNNLEEVLGYEE